MLNRLMFIYFIQKKGFLDNDPNYLRTKLAQNQEQSTDRYYKEFLCPLFFDGFAKPETERSRDVKRLLGKIPYLNGGLFQKHQIETFHGENIEIPDKAFEQLFNFFEQYQWHLDDRPLRSDNEINPDVLGYIFEKYVNERQKMGAYYTPEDITEYISKNTIIPFLFDAARKSCKIAFEGDASVWRLLQDDPDRYIYDAVKKGRDSDRITVGVTLDERQRDEVRRKVSEKLGSITPPISIEDWQLELHPVYDLHGETIEDLRVIELVVPPPQERNIFYTNSGELHVKTEGGKKKLSGPELTEFIRRHFQNDTEAD